MLETDAGLVFQMCYGARCIFFFMSLSNGVGILFPATAPLDAPAQGQHSLEFFTAAVCTVAWVAPLVIGLILSFSANYYAYKKVPQAEIDARTKASSLPDVRELIREQNDLLRELLAATKAAQQAELRIV